MVTAAQPAMVDKANKAVLAYRRAARMGSQFLLLLVAMAVTAVMAA